MNCLVIGASRGIGCGLTAELVKKGYNVSATVRTSRPSITGVKFYDGVDCNKIDTLKKLISQLEPKTFDIIYHVPGIKPDSGSGAPFEFDGTIKEDGDLLNQIRENYETNAIGVLKSFSFLEPYLKDGGKFAIVSTRMSSLDDNTSGGNYAYRMSKCALNMAVVNLIREERVKQRSLIIPLIHPGYIRTDMTFGKGNTTIDECVTKMVALVDRCDVTVSGKLLHALTGEILPW